MSKYGVLPSQSLRELLDGGFVRCEKGRAKVNAASIDLPPTEEMYRVRGLFLPRPGEKIRDLLSTLGAVPHNPLHVMERGVSYLIRLDAVVRLPKDVYGYCNPKSTTGRNAINVRVMADGVPSYDALWPRGYEGGLWLAVVPGKIPIIVSDVSLSQLRLFTHDTRLSQFELEYFMEKEGMLFSRNGKNYSISDLEITDNDGSIVLTLDFSQEPVGWECLDVGGPVDLSLGYPRSHYFRKLEKIDDHVLLKTGRFYILSTSEFVRVPPSLACEMAAVDIRKGEFRAHMAGYIDPGWGWGKEGERLGDPLTLEVIPHEDLLVRPNQGIAKIRFERMIEVPDIVYEEIRTLPDQRGPRLAKQYI